ncbi:MAG: hypothetical protein C0506_03005 [Anaerolinea sp.]|nr:hypothetical protein [Anaerolinea sp.]
MRHYVDSSVLVAHVLTGAPWLAHLPSADTVTCSELMAVEVARTIDRLTHEGRLAGDALDAALRRASALLGMVELIPVEAAVLDAARQSFGAPVKTLDAIHIASALTAQLRLGESLTFVTMDRQQARGAEAAGLGVLTLDGTQR